MLQFSFQRDKVVRFSYYNIIPGASVAYEKIKNNPTNMKNVCVRSWYYITFSLRHFLVGIRVIYIVKVCSCAEQRDGGGEAVDSSRQLFNQTNFVEKQRNKSSAGR